MLVQLFFLLPVSFSRKGKFIETKHMSGGVFYWHKALMAQRYLYGSIPWLPIKFYKTDFDLVKLFNSVIDDYLPDINLSDIFGNIFEKDNEDQAKILSKSKLSELITTNLNPNLLSNRSLKEKDESGSKEFDIEKCKNKGLKNIDAFGDSVASFGELGLTCEEIDEFVGQFISFGLIIIPIFIMGLIVIIFYIFYCFGCCCCCKAKDRYSPSVVSIVFFAIIASLLIIALGFNIAASVYIFDLTKYVLQGDAFKDIDYSLGYIKPSLVSIATDLQGNLTGSINDTVYNITDDIDSLVITIKDLIHLGVSNLTNLEKIFLHVEEINNTYLKNVVNSKGDFAVCAEVNANENCTKTVKYVNDNMIQEIPVEPFNEIISQIKGIKELLDKFNNSIDNLGLIEDAKKTLMDIFTKIQDKVEEADLPGKVEGLDTSKITSYLEDYEEGIPYKQYHKTLYATCFIFPMFMLILTSLEIMAFWLKNCCSRCIVCYCLPRCLCSCCLLFVGVFTTFMAFILIFIDIFYYQGDDLFDSVLKKMLNENRTIELGSLNLSKESGGMIPAIEFKGFTLEKPVMIKQFVDAKLNTKFTDFIAIFNLLPLDSIAKMIDDTFNGIKPDVSLITDKINITDMVGNYTDIDIGSLPTDNVSISFENKDEAIGYIKDACQDQNNCSIDIENVFNNYESLLNSLVRITSSAPDAMKEVGTNINNVVGLAVPEVLDTVFGLVSSVGGAFSSVVGTIKPSIDGTDAGWMISLFNILRVKCCRQLFAAAMSFSISAHLFLVGYAAMTILLCCRRKGMARFAKEHQSETLTDYSEYSLDEPKADDKKHRDSEKENTSDNSLVDINDQGFNEVNDKDVVVDDSEKYSDDQSNYINPYQHDDSSTYHINDESSIPESESLQPQVPKNESESSDHNNNEIVFEDDESTADNKINNVANEIKNVMDQQESENHPTKISENDDESSSLYPNNNNINFRDDESSGNNSDIDDGDNQTYVF